MGRREDFDNALWSDPDFLALSSEARMTYIWSWTNPRCGMAGLYKVAPAQAALETGYPVETVLAALVELSAADFAFYESNVLFVRTRARRLRTKSEQIAKAIRNDLMGVSDSHPLKGQFLSLYADQPWLKPYISQGRASVNGSSVEVHGNQPSEPDRVNLAGASTEAGSTHLGNGNGKGKGNPQRGRGVGKGQRYEDDPHWTAVRDTHFPDCEVGTITSIAAALQMRRVEPTVEAIRVLLVDDAPVVA